MKKIYFSVNNCINVILDIFRVGSYDRTVVMVIGFRKFIPLIWNARIKDGVDTVVDQPLYMSVCQLRRITLGFTRDGINSQFVYLAVGSERKLHSGYHRGIVP